MNTPQTLKLKSEQHEQSVKALRQKVEALPEVTKADLMPRVERVDTMSQALVRDAAETSEDTGAGLSTASELNSTLETELTSLTREVETISQGNPTTFDFVGDKLMNGIAVAATKVKETLSGAEKN